MVPDVTGANGVTVPCLGFWHPFSGSFGNDPTVSLRSSNKYNSFSLAFSQMILMCVCNVHWLDPY